MVCWTAQRLPSGSAKWTKEPQGWSSMPLTSTPRAVSSRCASSMSVTTTCMLSREPGAISVMPLPKAIEQAEPGGVIWTKRMSSLTGMSWSAWNPTRS